MLLILVNFDPNECRQMLIPHPISMRTSVLQPEITTSFIQSLLITWFTWYTFGDLLPLTGYSNDLCSKVQHAKYLSPLLKSGHSSRTVSTITVIKTPTYRCIYRCTNHWDRQLSFTMDAIIVPHHPLLQLNFLLNSFIITALYKMFLYLGHLKLHSQ